MRFIQKGEKILEVHNRKKDLPFPLVAAGFSVLAGGMLLFFSWPGFKEEGTRLAVLICGIILSLLGIVLAALAYARISRYRYYILTNPEEELWERNLLGTYMERLEEGRIEAVRLKIEPTEDLSARYKVLLDYSSGKSYLMEVTEDEDQAKAIADVLSFHFDKNLIRETPNASPEEFETDRFFDSLYVQLRRDFPQGLPRVNPPAVDFVAMEKARYRHLIRLLYPPKSLIYNLSLYFLLLTVIIMLAVLVVHTRYMLYGLGFLGLGLTVFLIINAIEGGSFEELIFTPENLHYHRHHMTAEIDFKIPLDEIKMILAVPRSGYKIQKLIPINQKAEAFDPPVETKEGVELYLITETAVVGIESWLSPEMANHLIYLIKNAIYIMAQKGEREN